MKRVAMIALLLGCSPGTIDVGVADLVCPIEPLRAFAYAIPDTACADCECGACDCGGDARCMSACPAQGCAIGEPVELHPPPGRYAVVVHYVDGGNAIVKWACSEVTIAADGTASSTETADPCCCEVVDGRAVCPSL